MDGTFFISIFDSIPLWVMLAPIFLCSIILLAVVIERSFFYRKIDVDYTVILESVIANIRGNNIAEAKICCHDKKGPFFSLITGIISRWDASDRELAIRDYSERTIRLIEKYGGAVSTIASVAPMLGLLGTVTGMMKSFSALAEHGASVQNHLARGITEALITTALGLCVAIPAVIFYNYMVSRIEIFVRDVEIIANEFVSLHNSSDLD
jgi:biopolymer transport protein ExbB